MIRDIDLKTINEASERMAVVNVTTRVIRPLSTNVNQCCVM
jgi:hypothetical protein